jgi:hypothetical protein
MLALQRPLYEVDLFNIQIDVITSVHKDCTEEYDWQTIKNSFPLLFFPFAAMSLNHTQILDFDRKISIKRGLFP